MNILIKVRAIPLSCQSEHLAIGGELKGLGGICAMHWNTRLSLLYIGLDTTAGDNAEDGARSIVVGSITKDKQLKLHAIAPESVFSTGREQEIVGSKGAGSRVTIHTIKSMNTSTSLDYLIVHGGNHSLHNTKRSVFALPLVNMRNEKGAPDEKDMSLHGQIACKDTLPEDLFGAVSSNAVFFGRRFKKPANIPEELPLASDKSIMVGGGPLVHGDIEDVVVQDDVVFVSVAHAEDTELPVSFTHEPFLMHMAVFKGWSAWARASSITDPVWRLKYNNIVGSFIALTADKANQPVNVVQTTWSLGEEHGLGSLVTLLTNEFPQNKPGCKGCLIFLHIRTGWVTDHLLLQPAQKK